MSKQKKKVTPQRRRSAKARPTPRRPKIDSMQFARAVCSITDPFCPAARGSKWPDQSAAASLPITVEGIIQVATDANGNAAVLLTPTYPRGYAVSNVINPTTGLAEFADLVEYASGGDFAGSARAYRLVSGGASLTSTASMMTSQGMMRGLELSGSGASGNNNYEDVELNSLSYTSVSTKPVRESGSMFGYFKPSGNEAREFNSFDDGGLSISDMSTNDWTALVFAVTGGPASTVVAEIRYVLHLELAFTQGNMMNRFATRPPPPNTMLTNASSYVSGKASSFITGVAANVEKTFMSKAISYASGALANWMLPGSGPIMGLLTNAAMEVD